MTRTMCSNFLHSYGAERLSPDAADTTRDLERFYPRGRLRHAQRTYARSNSDAPDHCHLLQKEHDRYVPRCATAALILPIQEQRP